MTEQDVVKSLLKFGNRQILIEEFQTQHILGNTKFDLLQFQVLIDVALNCSKF